LFIIVTRVVNLYIYFFLFIIRTPTISTLCPYTTLFRSRLRPVFDRWQVKSKRNLQVPAPPHMANRNTESKFLAGLYQFRLAMWRSEEHTSELQSHLNLVCRLLLEKKK